MHIELVSTQGVLCCLAFFFAGIVDSITGGGGLITIPVMLATGIPVRYITGTNQCSAWLGTGVAAYKYLKSGKVHLRSALITLPFAVVGAFLGARLNLLMSEHFLKIFMLPVIVVPIFLTNFSAIWKHLLLSVAYSSMKVSEKATSSIDSIFSRA